MSLFHAALQPALDENGDPINGATWNFYATGTLTAAAVYSSSSLGTSLGSTVTANASGRFATIFLDDNVTYRAILKDGSGVALKDIDPINNSVTAELPILTSFGAVGDGTTDDSTEIAAAVAAVGDRSFAGGGKTYKLASGTTLPAGFKMFDGRIEHGDTVNTQDDYSVVAWGFDALQANTFVPEQESSTYPAPITNWAHGNHIVAIGGEALKANTTGRRQTAVGSRALLQNTTGYYNTALGSHAMEKNTTGYNNVAVGVQANQEATTASDGVFIGNAAGLSVNGSKAVVIGRQAAQLNASTANMITCVGYRAGYSVTTADDIVCIGRDSGLNATTAARSTFVGANAGKNVTTQVEGTYIGWNAGQVASSAYNTVIGAYAGFALTTGAGATLMGRRAGYALTTGLDVVAIGQDALVSHTTGNNTVGIGRNAGVYNDTGSNNTYLGHSATSASGSPALSNVTCLGYQATATESNQVVLGNSSVASTVIQGVIRAPKTYVVTSLPSAAGAGAGARTFVTDATATTFASVAAGGGANAVPVYSDGTSWRIG